MRKRRKGLTLIEVVCVVAILGIMGSTIVMAFNTGILARTFTEKEYDLQTNMRKIADDVQNIVRYSTALFILPESSFNYKNVVEQKENYLTEGWNYIGLIKDKDTGLTKIVEYTYNGSKHIEKVLVEEREDLVFDVAFSQDYSIKIPEAVKTDPNVIEYSLLGYKVEEPDEPYIAINSEAESLNALQVVDWSTNYDKGVAIAYRSDERGRPVIGRLTMVLDTSGSMTFDMAGNETKDTDKKRITILKNTAKELLANLATEENIEVMIVPFNNYADKKGDYIFKSLAENHDELVDEINALAAGGGTNTGDGMRRAHHGMLNASSPQGAIVREYVILLADGDTNHGTLKAHTWNPENELDPSKTFQLDDDKPGNYTISRFIYTTTRNPDKNSLPVYKISGLNGDKDTAGKYTIAGGGYLNVIYEDAYQYVEEVGKLIADPKLEREFFVIGFSSSISEYCLSHLATNVGLTSDVDENGFARKFQANSEEDLANAFEIIKEAISYDLWYIKGPKTAPTM